MITKETKTKIFSIIEDARYDNKFKVEDKTLLKDMNVLLKDLLIDQEQTIRDLEMLEEHSRSLENKIYFLKQLIIQNN